MFGPKREARAGLSQRAKPAGLAGEGFRVLEEGHGERLVWRPGDRGSYELQQSAGGRWVAVACGEWLPDVLGVSAGPEGLAQIARRFPCAARALPFALRDYRGAPLPGAKLGGEAGAAEAANKWRLRQE